MAERLFRALGTGHDARSAGSEPGDAPHPNVVAALAEAGIDASDHVPRRIDADELARADLAGSTRAAGGCPVTPGVRRISWAVRDPKGLPLDDVRAIRDEIAAKVEHLAAEL